MGNRADMQGSAASMRSELERAGMGPELADFTYIIPNTVGLLARDMQTQDAQKVLMQSWRAAYGMGLVHVENSFACFPVWSDGCDPVAAGITQDTRIAILKPNTNPAVGCRWALVYAGIDKRGSLRKLAREAPAPEGLTSFAYVPWDTVLPEVDLKAQSERWSSGGKEYAILKNYLLLTYRRLSLQDEVAIDEDAGMAAFNTGLVSATYQDLYMCFEPNFHLVPAWKYTGICEAGERGLGKRLVSVFPVLPKRATYFESVADLTIDSSQELFVDYRHMLLDNIDRLPAEFLQRQMYDRPELLNLVSHAFADNDGRFKVQELLRDEIEADPEVLRRLRMALEDAVEIAKKKTQLNYRTAVPIYFPRKDKINLLLPLNLTGGDAPDVALALSTLASGAYQGETILTLEQAYMDARLIARIEGEWLGQGLN